MLLGPVHLALLLIICNLFIFRIAIQCSGYPKEEVLYFIFIFVLSIDVTRLPPPSHKVVLIEFPRILAWNVDPLLCIQSSSSDCRNSKCRHPKDSPLRDWKYNLNNSRQVNGLDDASVVFLPPEKGIKQLNTNSPFVKSWDLRDCVQVEVDEPTHSRLERPTNNKVNQSPLTSFVPCNGKSNNNTEFYTHM